MSRVEVLLMGWLMTMMTMQAEVSHVYTSMWLWDDFHIFDSGLALVSYGKALCNRIR